MTAVEILGRYQRLGEVYAVRALIGDLEVTVNVDTWIVNWASDWTAKAPLAWGRNYGPSTYGHTDVVLDVPTRCAVVHALMVDTL